jgi:hypothetical protein
MLLYTYWQLTALFQHGSEEIEMTKPVNFDPEFDAANFDNPVINPFLPLGEGNVWEYDHSDGGSNTVTVTGDTINILGVECLVVTDNEFDEKGELTEQTLDYFALDNDGRAWYFGEDTVELPSGDTAGTWRAGEVPEDGDEPAEPGIIMPAPDELEIGLTYFEEQAAPEALDRASIKSLDAKVDLEEFGVFEDALKTKNDTPLEPGVVEHKFYVEGLGNVLITSGGVTEELVSFEQNVDVIAVDTDMLIG